MFTQRYRQMHAAIRRISANRVPSMPKPTLYTKLLFAVEVSRRKTEYGDTIPEFGSPKMIFCVKFHMACMDMAHQILSM